MNLVGPVTEQLFPSLVREGEGLAARVLTAQGATADAVRQQLRSLIAGEWSHP